MEPDLGHRPPGDAPASSGCSALGRAIHLVFTTCHSRAAQEAGFSAKAGADEPKLHRLVSVTAHVRIKVNGFYAS
jgi:hypothetical protein